ncbi:glycosyltransferase family 4 protein [Chryseobacterium sp. GP-SGM7]|uniref:glycosyltransferase family 4 protein n=1 Tax=Chryseobacterium sp. GP-SGM7 TaxID=3411323 RepID=UPI003B967091
MIHSQHTSKPKKIKIAYLCTGDPQDKKIWSGTIFRMYDALQKQGFDIEWIEVGKFSAFQNNMFLKIEKFYKKIFQRGFNKNHFLLKALIASGDLTKKLKNSHADVVFAPTYTSELAFVKTKKPIIYLNDATFHQLLNYYGSMSGFGFISKKLTVLIEKLALKKADQLVFSSQWASQHAIDFYKISKNKVAVVKFGSNAAAPERILKKDYTKEITFLFLGVEWQRKGGQISLDAIKILHERNYNVKFLVVGCVPPIEDEVMNVIPFLNKNNPAEAQKIVEILQTVHFIFMPTRADCTPISFCEAASYGLPVISTDTGGVSAHVVSGETGILLPPEANAKEYADEIEKLLKNPTSMEIFAQNARMKYEKELNWEVWGERMRNIITDLRKV